MKRMFKLFSLLMAISLLISACAGPNAVPVTGGSSIGRLVEYALITEMGDGKMVFIGDSGGIDGVVNPTLSANVGDTIIIELSSGEGVEHNISFPDFNATSESVVGEGSSTTLEIIVDKGGSFTYICSVPGHKEAGMVGKFEVTGAAASDAEPVAPPVSNEAVPSGPVVVNNPATTGADVVRDPTEIPAPIGPREPTTVRIDLETIEIEAQLADGTTFTYWTFNGKVPGPFYRVRVGDTIEVHPKNLTNSTMPHSVDFHAVTGSGGVQR
ncbi:MAG TPA: multicopper oxidase domain-containing protein [Anaerolineales bacterium]